MQFLFIFFVYLLIIAGLGTGKAKRADNQTEIFLIQSGYRPEDLNTLGKYIVSIQFTLHFCGGTIIGNRVILTAAHCLFDKIYGGQTKRKPFDIKVLAGSAQRFYEKDGFSKFYEVKKLITHSEFYPRTFKHDIALLILKEDIIFNERTQKIELSDSKPKVGEKCTTLGWGRLFYMGPKPKTLTYGDFKILDDDACFEDQPRYFKDGQICMFSEGYKDELFIHRGDSGGPLICNGKIAGVCSFTNLVGGTPAFYTNVNHYRNWIAKNCSNFLTIGWSLNSFTLFIQILMLLIL